MPVALAADAEVLFNRDIRPILSDTCFHCHGFDSRSRKADLRLDTYEDAVAVRRGGPAIKPGDARNSEVWRRITSKDPKLVMPPPDSNKVLKPEQITLMGKWINQGAKYQKHWAFEPPIRTEAPVLAAGAPIRNDVDRFILAALEARGLKPSPEATRETLLRRVTLDLTGLPPALKEVDAFLADSEPGAYERAVDRLLASPHYGEHMARYWLDVARYGDTHGLHLDNERSIWPYRDWVVQAFNENLSFDQFTIWQLAGDLLPNPTREQLVASGFNRCNVSTSEGGAIDEEFQVRYAVDRVETTSAVWMGLTMGCAVCHDHKLDPISQKEFYEVFSIFNNIAENAMDGNALLPPPTLSLPTAEEEKQLKRYDSQLEELERQLAQDVVAIKYEDPAALANRPQPVPVAVTWIEDAFPEKADVTASGGGSPESWVTKDAAPVYSGTRAIRRTGKELHQVFFTKAASSLDVGSEARLSAYVYLDPKDPPRAIMLQFHTDGWNHRANWGDADAIPFGSKGTTEKVQIGPLPELGKWVKLEVEGSKVGIEAGRTVTGVAFTQFDGTAYWDKMGIVSVNDPTMTPALSLLAWQKVEKERGDASSQPMEIKSLLKKDALEGDERARLLKHYLTHVYAAPETRLGSLRAEMKQLREKRQQLEKGLTASLISKELEKPRPAYVLIRGEYDKHGEPVGPGVPSVLPPLPAAEITNRLTFARWLVDPGHPLTARVTVNRFWQQFFGIGLVKTSEDFGSKGEWPSHPELLDWLATEFMRNGWDMKRLVRLLVTSATYRQDSRVSRELLEADPENRLLARGPKQRLDAEVLRDEALFVSGLLNPKFGGRGVRTYQPSGIWEAVGYTTSNTAKYTQDQGDALYRRSLYLFWKRTAPPPSMITFDAPSREKCATRRERTNTPLQALLTMNDPQYFEAARHLGHRMLKEGGEQDADRLRYGFRLVTARTPSSAEQKTLSETLSKARERFAQQEDAARKVIEVGDSPAATDVPVTELAAYALVANLLLNLDETVTKN
jgi:hypothetical protein